MLVKPVERTESSGLRSNCLPFPDVLAQSVANIAPTLTPTVNAALVFASSGNATWLTFVVATLGLVFVGLNINQFAQRSAAPGSLYMYIARGLGPMAGVVTGWALMLAYLFTAIAVASGFANYGEMLLAPLGITPSPIFLLAICFGTGLVYCLSRHSAFDGADVVTRSCVGVNDYLARCNCFI